MTDPLKEELWRRLDADGSLRSHVQLARLVGDNRLARLALGALGVDKSQLSALVQLADQADQHVAALARVVEEFSAWGWAPSGLVPTEPYLDALRAFDAGVGRDEVEQVILRGWQDSMLPYLSSRLMGVGQGDQAYADLFAARAELVGLAWEDHSARRFHAAVPVVAAQIEGISFDVAGKAFFSKRAGVDPVDDTSLAGVHMGLPVAREWFSANVPTTVVEPEPSRHGVLHGRSLGYQTELISTKYFVLLASVLEWAIPLAEVEATRRRHERQTTYAGSQDVDLAGRRRDDREFDETQTALDYVLMGQLTCAHEGFRDQMGALELSSAARSALAATPGIVLEVSRDRSAWHAWRRTVSGWVLGIGGTSDQHDWYWDAAQPPASPPPSPGWHPDAESLPNWS